jgi:RNA polymerase sigma-70 factor (ECF subfamily)
MDDAVTVMLVGLEPALSDELRDDERFDVRSAESLEHLAQGDAVDAVVVAMNGQGPLELLGSLRGKAPDAAVVVVTGVDNEADGAVALHAGAEDHLVLGAIPPGLLPRSVRYAVSIRRLRRELATTDEVTGLPNLRGFVPIAEHHLRMADRSRAPVVFLFVRIDGDVTDDDAREAADVLLDAVRDADLPARVTPDTFSVLLTGDAVGAESLVPRVSSRRSPCTTPSRTRRDRWRSRSAAPCTSPRRPRRSRRSSRRRDAASAIARRADPSGRSFAANASRNEPAPRSMPPSSMMPMLERSAPVGAVDASEARDRELIARVRAGDAAAFRGLFDRYAPTAMALARRVVRQSHLAEEIVQEAFMAVWRDPGAYDGERGSVKGWLMGMVHHRAVDLVRREEAHRRRAEAAIPEAIEEQADHADEVVRRLGLPEEQRLVRAALDALPAEQRQVLAMMYFDGLSQSQIAERTGTPLGTVKSRTLLGMRRMRDALAGVQA